MKKTKIFKIWGAVQLGVGLIVVILAFIFKIDMDGPFTMPNPGILTLGGFLTSTAVIILIIGFIPEIVKLFSNIKSEIIDHAGKDISEATKKGAETVVPAVTPELKRAYKTIKDEKTIEEKLSEAQRLLDNKIITKEEYDQMRKRILGID